MNICKFGNKYTKTESMQKETLFYEENDWEVVGSLTSVFCKGCRLCRHLHSSKFGISMIVKDVVFS